MYVLYPNGNLFMLLDWRRDQARWFWIKQRLFWIPYERYEYTRLSQIREQMDKHRTYKKENLFDDGKVDDEVIRSKEQKAG